MGTTVRLRSRSARALGALMVLAALVGLVSLVVGGVDVLLDFGAPVMLFGLLGWGAFWEPYVEVSDGSVRFANTLRTVEVLWPAVEGVDGHYGLKLLTAYGPLTAWAADAPTGRQRTRGRQGRSAEVVSQRLEALRAAGHLQDRRLEQPRPAVTWHRGLLTAVVALVLASAILPQLT